VGQVVTIGQTLARLTRSRPLRVELSVPEAKAGALRLGTPVSFKVMGKLETFSAKVDAIESRFDEATRTIKLRARYDGAGELLAGSSVTVTLSQGSREGIFVPPEALSGDARGSILYVQKNGVAKAARVNIGIRDVSRIEVLSGIESGDTVLIVGASGLRPGKQVKVAKLVPSP
jgi:membrane fusion protein (multidrug efflux system)